MLIPQMTSLGCTLLYTFWNSLYYNKLPLANTVGGATGHKNIADMWHSHFKELFSTVKYESNKEHVLSELCISDSFNLCNVSDVMSILQSLEKGKSCAWMVCHLSI